MPGSARRRSARRSARARPAPSPRGRRVCRPRASRGAPMGRGTAGPPPARPRRPRTRACSRHRRRLVFPDGATKMGVLGGGGLQTAFGLRAHPSDLAVGLAAVSAPTCPPSVSRGFDERGGRRGLALVVDRGEASRTPAPASAPAWEGGALDAPAWDRSSSPSSLPRPDGAAPPARGKSPNPTAWTRVAPPPC